MAGKDPQIIAQLDPKLLKQLSELSTSLASVAGELTELSKGMKITNTVSVASAQAINELVSALKDSKAGMSDISKSAKATGQAFTAMFGSSKEFNNFITSINGITKDGVAGLKAVSQAIRDLTVVSIGLQNQGATGGTATTINSLAQALKLLSEQSTLFNSINLAGVRNFTSAFEEMTQKLAGAGFTDSLRLSINSISTFASVATKINNIEGLSGLNKKFIGEETGPNMGLIYIIRKIISEINSFPSTDNAFAAQVSTSLNSLSDIVKALIRLQLSFTRDGGETIAFTANKILPSMKEFIKDFFGIFLNSSLFVGVSDISSFKNLVNSVQPVFSSLINFIEQFVRLGTKRIEPENLDSLKEYLPKYISTIQSITVGLSASKFNSDVKAVGDMMASTRLVLRLFTTDLPLIVKTINQLKTAPVELDSTLLRRMFGLTKIDPLLNIIDHVLTRLTSSVRTAIPNSIIERVKLSINMLKSFITFVPEIVKLAKSNVAEEVGSNIINRLLNLTKLDPVFRVVDYIVKRMGRISTRNINKDNIESIRVVLSVLRTMGQVLPKVVEYVSDNNVLDQLNARFFSRILRMTKLEPLFVLLSYIAKRVNSLPKMVDNATTFKLIVTDLRSISKLVTTLNDLPAIDTSIISKVQAAINSYSQVTSKINPGKLAAVMNGFNVTKIFKSDNNQDPAPEINSVTNVTVAALQKISDKTSVLKTAASTLVSAKTLSNINNFMSILNNLLPIIDGLRKSFTELKTSIQDSLSTASEDLKGLSDSLFGVANTLNSTFGVNRLLNNNATTIALDYEELTSQLKVFAQFNEEALKEASDFADFIGVKYPLSANQALKSILELSKAGLSLPDIKSILPTSADLASLSDSGDLNQSTAFLIAAAKGFEDFSSTVKASFDSEALQGVSDVIFRTANATSASVDSLQQGLSRVAPAARTFSMDLESATYFLAQFNDAQIKGEEAGTLLGTVLTSVFSEKSRDVFKQLNIDLADSEGNLRDLNSIIIDLQRELAGYTEEGQRAIISQIGDVYGQRGLSILLGRGGIDSLRQQAKVGLTAAEAAQELLTSVKGNIEQLRGSLETVYKNLMLPFVEQFLLPTIRGLRFVVDSIATLPKEFYQVVASFATILSVFATFSAVAFVFSGVVTLVTSSLLNFVYLSVTYLPKALKVIKVLSLLSSIAGAGLLLFGSIVFSVARTITTFYNEINKNGSELERRFSALKSTITGFFKEVTKLGKDFYSAFSQILLPLFGGTGGDRINFLADTMTAITKSISKATSILKDFNEQGGLLANSVFLKKLAYIKILLQPISKGIGDVTKGLITLFSDKELGGKLIKDGMNTAASRFAELLGAFTGMDVSLAVARFDSGKFVEGIKAFIESSFNQISVYIRQNSKSLESFVKQLVSLFSPLSGAAFILNILGLSDLSQILKDINTAISNGVSFIVLAITGRLSQERPNLRYKAGEYFGVIGTAFFDIVTALGGVFNTFKRIVNSFVSLFSDTNESQSAFAKKSTKSIINLKSMLQSLLQTIASGVTWFNENILEPIAVALPLILNRITSFARTLATALEPAITIIRDLGKVFSVAFNSILFILSGGNVQEGLERINVAFTEFISNLRDNVSQILINFGTTFNSEFLTQLGTILKTDGFKGLGNLIYNTIKNGLSFAFDNLLKYLASALKFFGINIEQQIIENVANKDYKAAIFSITRALFDVVRQVISGMFTLLVENIDIVLDQYENRFVGALHLTMLALGPTAISIIGKLLFAKIKTFAAAKFLELGAFMATQLNLAFLKTLSATQIGLILAAILGALALVGTIFAVAAKDIEREGENILSKDAAQKHAKRFVKQLSDSVVSEINNLGTILLNLPVEIEEQNVITQIGNFIKGISDSLRDAEASIARVRATTVAQVRQTIKDIFKDAPLLEAIVSRIAIFLDIVYSIVQNLTGAFAGTTGMLSNLFLTLGDVSGDAIGTVTNLFTILSKLLSDLMRAIKNIIAGIIRLGSSILNAIIAPFIAVYEFFKNLFSTIMDFLNGIVKFVKDAFAFIKSVLADAGDELLAIALIVGGAVTLAFIGARNAASGFALKIAGLLILIEGIAVGFNTAFKEGNALVGLFAAIETVGMRVLEIFGLDKFINKEAVKYVFDLLSEGAHLLYSTIGRAIEGLFNRIQIMFADTVVAIEKAIASIRNIPIAEGAQSYINLRDISTKGNLDINQDGIADQGRLSGIAWLNAFYNAFKDNADKPEFLAVVYESSEQIRQAIISTFSDPMTNQQFGWEAAYTWNAEQLQAMQQLAAQMDITSLRLVMRDPATDFNEGLGIATGLMNVLGMESEKTQSAITQLILRFIDMDKNAAFDVLNASVVDTNGNVIKMNEQFFSLTQQMFELGKITEEEYVAALRNMGYAYIDNQVILEENVQEYLKTKAAVDNLAYSLNDVNNAADATALDAYNQALIDGKQNAIDMADAINDLTEALKSNLERAKAERLVELQRQLDEGLITSSEYATLVRDTLNEVYDNGIKDIDLARQKLFENYVQGLIDTNEYERELKELEDYAAQLNTDRDLQIVAADLRVRVANKLLTPQQAAQLLQDEVKKIRDKANSPEGTSTIDVPVDVPTTPTPLTEEEKAYKDFVTETENDIESLVTKAADTQKKLDESREDFIFQSNEDYIAYQNESVDLAKEHQQKLLEIQEGGAEELEEAVAMRDSGAAQQALKNRIKQENEEKARFKQEEEQRAIDFQREQEANARKQELEELRLQRELEGIQTQINEKQNQLNLAAQAEQQKTEVERAGAIARNNILTKAMDDAAGIISRFSGTAINALLGFDPNLAQNVATSINTVWGAIRSVAGILPGLNNNPSAGPITGGSRGGTRGVRVGYTAARAMGGSVQPSGLYRVGENEPELLRQNNQLYLIPGQRGFVQPVKQGSFSMGGAGDVYSVSVDLGGIQINESVNAGDVVRQVERVLVPKITEAVRMAKDRKGRI